MGLLKKIFKPVSKVLDKVIPNEIKPALPYLAAFAPMFGPTSGLMGDVMLRRALISGGLNIGAQLAQEGNEGEINLLSAGLGALTGAMTAPGAAETFRGAQSANVLQDANVQRTALQKATDFGLEGLAKGSEMFAAGAEKGLFSKEGLKAATLPAATATGDVMQAQARQLEKQAAIDAALAEAEALGDIGGRAAAIRNAMNAYGFFTEEEIEDTIASAGYKSGGRVGFEFGGIERAIENVTEEMDTKSKEGIMAASKEDPLLIEEYNRYVFDLLENRPSAKPMSFQEFKRMIKSGFKSGGRVKMEKGGDIKEGIMLVADETGGEADFGSKEYYEKEVADEILDLKKMMDEDKMYHLAPWRVGMIERLIINANNKGVDILELTEVYEDAKNSQAEWFQTLDEDTQNMWKKHYQEDFDRTTNMGIFPGQQEFGFFKDLKGASERDEKVPAPKEDPFDPMKPPVQEAKDGGLMNLGGKEMDLRGGGFVPIGKKERADDVPARLSKNEFVMTADAVRAAGGGSVNKGAKRMYNLMNTLEARA
jgi:hypothetical protein